jgi:hypothetical protein
MGELLPWGTNHAKKVSTEVFICLKATARGINDFKIDTIGCFFMSCILLQAPAVSANKGVRYQAALLVAVVQKGVNGTAHNHAKKCLNRRILLLGKQQHVAST